MHWSIWLAHHSPEHANRCTLIGKVAVCRRCLACWPLAFSVIALCLARSLAPAGLIELTAWWTLPLAEYVGVHVLGRPYGPRRTWFFGALLGVALGRTLHRYLLDPFDVWTWAVLGVVSLVGGLSAAAYHLRLKNSEVL
jgi:hypothetical protein